MVQLVGALEHFLFFHILSYIENSHPNWLSYFSEVLKPPTSQNFRPRTDFGWKLFVFTSCFNRIRSWPMLICLSCVLFHGRLINGCPAWTIKHSDINHWKIEYSLLLPHFLICWIKRRLAGSLLIGLNRRIVSGVHVVDSLTQRFWQSLFLTDR